MRAGLFLSCSKTLSALQKMYLEWSTVMPWAYPVVLSLSCVDWQHCVPWGKEEKITCNYQHSAFSCSLYPQPYRRWRWYPPLVQLSNYFLKLFFPPWGQKWGWRIVIKVGQVLWRAHSTSKIHSDSHISSTKQNTSFLRASAGSVWILPTGHSKEINIVSPCTLRIQTPPTGPGFQDVFRIEDIRMLRTRFSVKFHQKGGK